MPTVFTSIPTDTYFPTAFFTPIPTDTPKTTPTRILSTQTATTEPAPFTSFDKVFVNGVSKSGENIYGNPYDLFHIIAAQPNDFAAFRFTMQITAFHFIKNELTPTPTALPIEKWKILIYRYETDGVYINRPVIETYFKTNVTPYTNKLLMYMTADVSMDTVQTKFGDCRAFTYQVIDERGKIHEQGYFSINHYLVGGGLLGNINDGVTIGYPYSLNEKETEFFHQGKFVTITELKSGFYRLTYDFNFISASGVSGVDELIKLANELTIRFYPYNEEGNYSTYDTYPATGNLIAAASIYRVNLPIDYLKENASINNKYYLQVVDGKGEILRDDYFLFIPYAP
jgi:hypothetical protein